MAAFTRREARPPRTAAARQPLAIRSACPRVPRGRCLALVDGGEVARGGGDVGVAEQLLQPPKRGARLGQVAQREAVPQRVRMRQMPRSGWPPAHTRAHTQGWPFAHERRAATPASGAHAAWRARRARTAPATSRARGGRSLTTLAGLSVPGLWPFAHVRDNRSRPRRPGRGAAALPCGLRGSARCATVAVRSRTSLRVVRERPRHSPLRRPTAPPGAQLTLAG
jgi:hypothetical protein